MTQKQLAEACGITEPAIRNYELDNRIPSYDTLDDIADALHVNYYTLAAPILAALAGVMHCFFRMEYVHGLTPIEQAGRSITGLHPNRSACFSYSYFACHLFYLASNIPMLASTKGKESICTLLLPCIRRIPEDHFPKQSLHCESFLQ